MSLRLTHINNPYMHPKLFTKHVVNTVCKICEVSEEELKSKTRKRKITDTRKLLMYVLNEIYPHYTYAEFGKHIDITSSNVGFAIRKAEVLIVFDKDFKQKYDQITTKLGKHKWT